MENKTTIETLKPVTITQDNFRPARILKGDVVELDTAVAKDLISIGHARYIKGVDPFKPDEAESKKASKA